MALKVSFGQGGKPSQWYLPGTDTALLPPGPPGGQPPVADALTDGPNAPAWDDTLLFGGLVEADTIGGTAHSFDVVGGWNSVKNAFAQSDQAEELRFDGFVQVDIDVGRGDAEGASIVTVVGAKRGNIVTGEGDDVIRVEMLSNEASWNNEFRIATGGGDDVVELTGLDRDGELAGGDTTYASFANGAGGTWDVSGRMTRSFVDLGAGNDRFIGHGSDDTVTGGEGNDLADGGEGEDVWVLSGLRDGYGITRVNGRILITDTNASDGDDGRDDIGGFERARFGDGSEISLTTLTGLTFWNRLGDAGEVAASEIGPDGTLVGGTFVQGVFGGAWRATSTDATQDSDAEVPIRGISFPSSVINAASGTIEFWARLEGFSGGMGINAHPGLVTTAPVSPGDGSGHWNMGFTENDGGGGYGFVGQAGDANFTGTNAKFSPPTFEEILDGRPDDWHHFALSWSSDGFATLGQPDRETMLFLDGVPVSSHWEERVLRGSTPEGEPVYGTGELVLPYGDTLVLAFTSGPGWPAGSAVAFDNLKVWSVAKTDFSDRFDEDAGAAEPKTIAPIMLSDIAAGNGGFKITGELDGDQLGMAGAAAGDVNGDGLADLMVGGYAFFSGTPGAGYVVFGKADTTPVSLSEIATGTTSEGYKIRGENGGDVAGHWLDNVGDMNGDGTPDMIINAYFNSSLGEFQNGAAYVVFGKDDGAVVELAEIASGTSEQGFKIRGESTGDIAGSAIAGAGDINGDGIPDVIVSARYHDSNGAWDSGAVYAVFGKADGSTIDLSTLASGSSSKGFKILGQAASDEAGTDVGRAGDLNGDGLADILLTAHNNDSGGRTDNGTAYLVFGKPDGATIDLDSLDSGPTSQGFRIIGENDGDRFGLKRGIGAMGDVNGDGMSDIIGSAPWADSAGRTDNGAVYVVFGQATFDDVDLRDVASGMGGFKIIGEDSGDGLYGIPVAPAGDLNGDGLADLLIGTLLNDSEGRTDNGAAYVVFGKRDGETVDLRDVARGIGGFKIIGERDNDNAGSLVAGLGDVDGDGLSDILVGASVDVWADMRPGKAYVIFGQEEWIG